MATTEMVVDIAVLLDAAGYGDYVAPPGIGGSIFGGTMPDQPSNAIALYEHTGFEPTRTMGGNRINELNLQVIVRNTAKANGRLIAFQIYELLEAFNLLSAASRVLNGVQYFSILARHAPFTLGQDENKRHKWTCTYIVRRR